MQLWPHTTVYNILKQNQNIAQLTAYIYHDGTVSCSTTGRVNQIKSVSIV